ncbi:hypothetical protein KJ853_01125 [Patescibacteria group bacterium]|nr:hypothetical protein [Patescibacteria group bacterium]
MFDFNFTYTGIVSVFFGWVVAEFIKSWRNHCRKSDLALAIMYARVNGQDETAAWDNFAAEIRKKKPMASCRDIEEQYLLFFDLD